GRAEQVVRLELARLGRRRARRERRGQQERADARCRLRVHGPTAFSAPGAADFLSVLGAIGLSAGPAGLSTGALSSVFFRFAASTSAFLVRAIRARTSASDASRDVAWARSFDAVIFARIRSACLRVRSRTSRT